MMFIEYIEQKPSSNIYDEREQLELGVNTCENQTRRRRRRTQEENECLSEEAVVV